ncbi:UDP-glucose 4-epimerase GalE (plasmid) [Thalassobaculum sp. OXR-137]|uniref:UDP-glucose 4-epimerase GalE n=1 Tax=Thalassobaculum sp. OXR-137 TaxID=3100173 RepID=UPI002AC9DD5B|nr:UDP-glucose 4-epimerase GalE [Thalassobaculum sp. OXR-137]WPZ37257.1 UDP-glucose 4-epimerase GalE [Thalassobaculum sp. OXR-137]
MAQTVLVTGGAGYVGSHVCLALARAGYAPITIDDLSDGHRKAVQFGPLEELDIRHREIATVIARYRPSAVIHAAAKSEVVASFRDPTLYYQVNVLGTLNLIRACRVAEVPHFVMISSAAVYGQVSQPFIAEANPTQPINPYGMTKLSGEMILADPSEYRGSWAALRLFNVAGAAAAAGLGEDHKNESHLIPLTLRAAYRNVGPLSIFGTTHPTFDGSAVRDYVHVMDVADAVLLTLSYLREGGTSRAFNIGSGVGISVLQVVEAVERATGYKVPIRVVNPREGDAAALVADISQAQQSLGFRPASSFLDTIVADAKAWELRQSEIVVAQGEQTQPLATA